MEMEIFFGTENAGDRDDSEELNWLQQGKHYGFPWVIGGNETPSDLQVTILMLIHLFHLIQPLLTSVLFMRI
ncbi:MAG: hypothetical protein BalsKO_15600 [Balneolaceae bacterium]